MLERTVRAKSRRASAAAKAMVSGGAPETPRSGGFFLSLGIHALQGYGQERGGSCITCLRTGASKSTHGRTTSRQCRCAHRRRWRDPLAGDNVMKGGYWTDPERTAHALDDGWLIPACGMIDDGRSSGSPTANATSSRFGRRDALAGT